MENQQPEMTGQAVIELVELFEQNDLEVIIDGGWGVDALLGRQTRPHADLDIVVAYRDVQKLRLVLEGKGFTDVPRPDTRPVNFVMGDACGRLVDVHTYTLDRENHPEQGLDYPLESLQGEGRIKGHRVRCIDVRNMVQFHSGYALDENDYKDVKALCQQFNIPLPDEFAEFERENLL